MGGTYSLKDIKRIFPDVKPRTLMFWVESGVLSPLVSPTGRGSVRKYSFQNLMEIGVLQDLTYGYGMTRSIAKKCLYLVPDWGMPKVYLRLDGAVTTTLVLNLYGIRDLIEDALLRWNPLEEFPSR